MKREFCAACGAGLGTKRRAGEGTCPRCDRDGAVLADFVRYCAAHPDERFWQALRNWSGVMRILAEEVPFSEGEPADTFYWEGRDG